MITGYHNLPIGKYQRIISVLKERQDDIDVHAAIVAILNDMTEEEVLNLPLLEYKKLSEPLGFIMEPLPKYEGKVMKEYIIGDIVLVPVVDIKKFTAAQYIDYQTLIKEEDKLIELMSTLLVPKGHTYANGYDLADVQCAISKMPVMLIAELSAFFLQKWQDLMNRSLISLDLWTRVEIPRKQRKEITEMIRTLRSSLASGDGYPISNQ